jgi:cytochrome P450
MTTMLYPPGPKAVIPALQFFAFRRDPLGFLVNLAHKHGDIAHFRMGPQHAYLFNHPDLIKDVLVTRHDHFHKGRALQRAKRLLGEGLLTSEEAHHRRQRRLAQPAFHRQHVAGYAGVMVDYAARTSDRWRDGESLDISGEMMRLTLGIVGKTLFDADVEKDAGEVGEAMTEMMELFNLLLLPYSELLEKLPLPQSRRFARARARLDAVIYRIIDERRRGDTDRGDLLSMLLLAEDEEERGSQMSNEQVRDEALTIFLAGHETTANALSWTWYLLAQHPEIESKLYQEIDAVLDGGRLPRFEDLPRLRYTEMVFAEAMRMYPPGWAVGRLAIKDFEVGGYVLPAGSLVLLSQYVTHHDARFFPDPARFDPERFTPEAKDARPQFAYFPFGGGPRRCIGEGFALMEGVLLLATLARRWRIRLVPGHAVEMRPRITLRPGKAGVPVTLERRQ